MLPPELVAAHVTVLWPFLSPDRIDKQTVAELADICSRHPRHAFALERVAVFNGGGVYLPPQPSTCLLQLMHAVWKRWPEWPPYGGHYAEVTPHVTVAAVEDDPTLIREVVRFAEPFLPIRAEARELNLILVREDTWKLLHRFPLAAA
jgi:hypothetical protein